MSAPLPRARRRELHRSRSVAVSVALGMLILLLVLIGTESVLAAVGLPALVLAPAAALEALGEPGPAWAIPAAAGLAVLGVVAISLAVAPGRRARHALERERFAVVVDDGVLASAVSRTAANAAGVPQEQVATTVSRRVGRVDLRPTSGFPVAHDQVRSSAAAVVEALAVSPAMRTVVRIDSAAVVAR